jgi:hypothetical protein
MLVVICFYVWTSMSRSTMLRSSSVPSTISMPDGLAGVKRFLRIFLRLARLGFGASFGAKSLKRIPFTALNMKNSSKCKGI